MIQPQKEGGNKSEIKNKIFSFNKYCHRFLNVIVINSGFFKVKIRISGDIIEKEKKNRMSVKSCFVY